MWSFLADLIRTPDAPRTVVVMDESGTGAPRQYTVTPKRLLFAWGGTLLLVALVTAALVAFTPVRTLIPGYGTEELRQNAQRTAVRVSALQDSVAVQRRYIERLQQLLTGRIDSVAQDPGDESSRLALGPSADEGGDGPDSAARPAAGSEADGGNPSGQVPATGPTRAVPSLDLPARPPVEGGFPTRRLEVQGAHYGTDIAVAEGTRVRAIGPGVVVLADWTEAGGHTIAVQHAEGYLSVYKHNEQLLKQTGDRVQAQEAVAVSGNTGEITSGPHVHFELWRNGLAQDPRSVITGW
ncbi:MAG: M23 family metallopeptidase [Salinivenus sp.]